MSVRRLAKDQPASFAFSPATLEKANWWIAKYPAGRQQSAVIPILWLVQKQEGWVSEPAIRAIAELLDMPVIRVLEVATFYTMFSWSRSARRALIQVCGTTPCMLRGADELMARLQGEDRRQGPPVGRRPVHLAGGRVPGRLLQRADGPDQRLLLRGPDAGDAWSRSSTTSRAGKTPQARLLRSAARAPRPRAGRLTLTDPTLYDGSAGQADQAAEPARARSRRGMMPTIPADTKRRS